MTVAARSEGDIDSSRKATDEVHSGSEKDCRSFSVTLINRKAWLWPLARQAERQRNLQLPPDATVGQARHCFGLPLPDEAVTMGNKIGDETALWQISQQC